jgi:tRNA pseudouridine38-40 synthase
MSRFFIELAFNGARYFGWQVQPGHPTVQEVLEKCFSAFLRTPVAVTGAGRTDTGVHASFFVAHFDAENLPFDAEDMVYKLNRFLPEDISLHRIRMVLPEAHARFSALSRTYRYFISRNKDPFLADTSFRYLLPLHMEKMNEAASLLLKYTDFTSFSKLHTDTKTNLCGVTEAYWEQKDHQLVFTITADRFLRNMVRAITGTLLEVGKGKLSVEGFEKIILKKDRCAAGMSMPAKGLFLTGIAYPESIYL